MPQSVSFKSWIRIAKIASKGLVIRVLNLIRPSKLTDYQISRMTYSRGQTDRPPLPTPLAGRYPK